MAHALTQWAECRPEEMAYRFLGDGEEITAKLTFDELLGSAQRLADELETVHGAGSRIVLIYPSGLEFIVALMGCMLAGMVAVPIVPPRPGDRGNRALALIRAADPACILTTSSMQPDLKERLSGESYPPIVASDTSAPVGSCDLTPPKITAETLALLQFTSGSTAEPKGVMLTHGHLAENQRMIQAAFGHDQSTILVGWLPLFHDMGLIGNVMQPLFLGRPCILLPSSKFLAKPERWLRAVSRFRATTSGAPNFAYDLCVDRIPSENLSDLDLSCWRVAYTGSEMVRAGTLERFAQKFQANGFKRSALLPCYGMAETTLLVSGGAGGEPIKIEDSVVSCGRPAPQVRFRIVDPETMVEREEGQIGEVWISAPSVASGYWRKEEETYEQFHCRLPGDSASYLRTGDLGFFKHGELFVTGRLKELIIVRGQNHHPQDIERTAQRSHPALAVNLGAAFSVEVENEEEVILVQEVQRTALRGLDVDEVGESVRAAVASAHGLRLRTVILLRPASLPRTTSGKIRRVPVREMFLAEDLAKDAVVAISSDRVQTNADEVLDWLRDYAETRIHSRLIDERRTLPPHIVLDFGNRGLFGLQAPREFGGLDLDTKATLRVIEQLGAIDQTLCLLVGVHNVLGLHPILKHGSPEMREALLPDLASGRKLAAFALTESGAGSNPLGLQAVARAEEPEGWRLYGEKVWTGLGSWASVINVFVRTEGSFSGFVVTQGSPGLRQGEEALTMGMRGIIQNSVQLEGVAVGRADQLADIGEGMFVAQEAMNYGRLVIAASCIGGMKRAAQIAVRYASRRQIATGRLLDNPVTLDRLESIVAATRSLESLVYRIADCMDQGRPVPEELFACCKILGPELFWQTADWLVQLLGGRGYVETNIAPQLLRDARVLRIFEGPTETLCDLMGRRTLSRPENLLRFLQENFEAGDSVAQLQSLLAEMRERRDDSSLDPDSLQVPFGEAVAYSVLAVAAANSSNVHTTAWSQSVFETKRWELRQRTCPERRQPDGQALIREIDAFASEIGDIEQSAAGEDQQLDPMLRRQPEESRPAVHESVPQTEPQPATSMDQKKTAAELEEWFRNWLASRLKTDVARINGDSSFAALGVDSLTAVELAADLGEWIGQELEDTFLWEHPTIDRATEYLAQESVMTLAELRRQLEEIERELETSDEH